MVHAVPGARILGVSPKRVTNMRWAGQLKPVATPNRKIGGFDRAQVEALAAAREARRLETERRRTHPPAASQPVVPRDQEAAFEELTFAAKWTSENPGAFVTTEGAAEILGVNRSTSAGSPLMGACRGCPRGAREDSRRGCIGGRKLTSSRGHAPTHRARIKT
jgi:hypothetical protein